MICRATYMLTESAIPSEATASCCCACCFWRCYGCGYHLRNFQHSKPAKTGEAAVEEAAPAAGTYSEVSGTEEVVLVQVKDGAIVNIVFGVDISGD